MDNWLTASAVNQGRERIASLRAEGKVQKEWDLCAWLLRGTSNECFSVFPLGRAIGDW